MCEIYYSLSHDVQCGETPLIMAVIKGDTELVRLLLKHGANHRLVDEVGHLITCMTECVWCVRACVRVRVFVVACQVCMCVHLCRSL